MKGQGSRLRGTFLALLLPAALALALSVPGMTRETFRHEDEWRNLVMTREMSATGPVLFPTLHGTLYPDYPPLYFWIALLGARIDGQVGPFAGRLPSAIGAALVAFSTALLVTRLGSARLGMRAGLVTAILPGLWYEETRAMIDPLFCGFTTLALALLAEGDGRDEKASCKAARLALGSVALGLSWLTKGPLGAVLVLLALAGGEGLGLLGQRRPGELVKRCWIPIAAILVIGVVWYGTAYLTKGWDFARNLLVEQTLARFSRRVSDLKQHEEPWYFFFRVLPILLPALVFAVWEGALELRRKDGPRAATFALGWFGIVFLFLSLSNTKRSYYLLPAYPAVGILAACFFERTETILRERRGTILKALAVPIGIVALFAPFAGNFDADLGRQGLALGAAAFASAALLLFSEKRQLEAFVAASAFLLAAGGGAVLPEVEKRQGYHGFAQDVLKTGVEKGEIALTPGGLHREHLCWELAPVTTGARLLLAADLKSDIPDRSTVLSYLRERPPRKRAVILRKEHLRIFDAALKQDIELVADSEPDELGGLVAIERKE